MALSVCDRIGMVCVLLSGGLCFGLKEVSSSGSQWVRISSNKNIITGVTYTRVVVYLRRTLEGPFLHLFFGGVLKLFCVHLFGGFLWPEIFPRIFYPQKIKKKFFDFGAPETARAVMGSLCAQK